MEFLARLVAWFRSQFSSRKSDGDGWVEPGNVITRTVLSAGLPPAEAPMAEPLEPSPIAEPAPLDPETPEPVLEPAAAAGEPAPRRQRRSDEDADEEGDTPIEEKPEKAGERAA
ncbi:MAG: hypothetical protein HYX53_18325 [Chloroflexi bacterium]|nr:hypothetical protein [Chloroflexota bacterium]